MAPQDGRRNADFEVGMCSSERTTGEVIGVDAGGSGVCLGIHGDRYGKVYFWSVEDAPEPPDPTSYENTWLVADSFDAFVESFHEPSPE